MTTLERKVATRLDQQFHDSDFDGRPVDRRQALMLLEDVASGNFSNYVRGWLRHIATALLDADSKDAGRLRDAAIIRAIGLDGSSDKHHDLRQFLFGAATLFGSQKSRLLQAVRICSGGRGDCTEYAKEWTEDQLSLLRSMIATFDLGEKLRVYRDLDDEELGRIIYWESKKSDKHPEELPEELFADIIAGEVLETSGTLDALLAQMAKQTPEEMGVSIAQDVITTLRAADEATELNPQVVGGYLASRLRDAQVRHEQRQIEEVVLGYRFVEEWRRENPDIGVLKFLRYEEIGQIIARARDRGGSSDPDSRQFDLEIVQELGTLISARLEAAKCSMNEK